MNDLLKTLPIESVEKERIKGAQISVYFRWIFVAMITFTASVQFLSGYQAESLHSIRLIAVYFLANLGLWQAVRRKYDPLYLGYLSAMLDVGIIAFHLYYLSVQFDLIAATAAATTFLFPIIFLLYTFRLNRTLLVFIVTLSLVAFNVNYFIQYPKSIELFSSSLSLTPISQVFKIGRAHV